MRPKLGIIAGSGQLPIEIIQSCLDTSRDFFVIALVGQASKNLVENTPHLWVRPGAAGKAIKALRKAGVKQLVLAGGVRRPSIFNVWPDFWTAGFIFRTGALSFGDDGLLKTLVNNLETNEGFEVVGADELLPHLITREGVIGSVGPTPPQFSDINLGVKAAFELGEEDVGQAVVVKDGDIIGREDKKGTDALIRRINQTQLGTGGILVKMKKPKQERRADLPAIGPNTIIEANKAGLAGIALEAGSTFILGQDEVIKKANETGVFIIGINAGTK